MRSITRGIVGLRGVVVLVLLLGAIVGATRGMSAQGGAPGVDGNTFTSPNYDYSLTWDESAWRTSGDLGTDAGDVFGLTALSAYAFANLTTFPADGSQGYCLGYQDQFEGTREIEITQDYGRPTPPDGSTTITYLLYPQEGDTNDVVHYVVCATLTDAGDELQLVFIAEAPDFNDLVPQFNAVIEGLTLPALTEDAAGESAEPLITDYADPSGSFSLQYDGNAWFAVPALEGEEGILLLNQGADSTGASLYVTRSTDYGASVADCIADAPSVANLTDDVEPRELAEGGSLVEGLGIEGSEQTVFVNTFDAQDGASEESWIVVNCAPLGDDAVLIIQLTARESRIADAVTLAKAVIDTLQLGDA